MKVGNILLLASALLLSVCYASPYGLVLSAHALGCPVNTTSGNGDTFNVVVTGADGSCPSTYSSSGTIHYVLSTAPTKNPYTVVLSKCVGSNCPPTNIRILGWDPVGDRCGGSKPACSTTGPWTFTIDATVQRANGCDTAPVKVTGNSGQPVLILEAGLGGVCAGTPPNIGIPQFPYGIAVLFAASVPILMLLRRHNTAG